MLDKSADAVALKILWMFCCFWFFLILLSIVNDNWFVCRRILAPSTSNKLKRERVSIAWRTSLFVGRLGVSSCCSSSFPSSPSSTSIWFSSRNSARMSSSLNEPMSAPRKYQLDVEKVKKWPGLKLSQNNPYGPYLQNRRFMYDRVNNIFFTEFFTSRGLKWAKIMQN